MTLGGTVTSARLVSARLEDADGLMQLRVKRGG